MNKIEYIESMCIYKNGRWKIYIPDAEKDALLSMTIQRIAGISRFDAF